MRHEEFVDYKATRKPMPDDLIPQIPFIKDVVRGLSICVLEKQGVEADDIIGTLSRRASKQGWRTVIVSGDKDLMQLVDENVTMIDTMKDKTYDVTAVKERFGVGPTKWWRFLASWAICRTISREFPASALKQHRG